MEFDSADGSVLNATSVDLGAVTSGAVITPIEVMVAANGELWISDQIADEVHRLASDGSTFLGASSGAFDNIRGLAPFGTGALVTNTGTTGGAPGPAVIETDMNATAGASHTSGLVINPFDAEPFVFNGISGFLVSEATNDDIIFVDAADPSVQQIFHDSDGVSGVNFPEQIHVTASGRVLVAGFGAPSGVYEYDPSTGNEINYFDTESAGVSGLRGVYELEDGNFLISNNGGVHVYDVTSNTTTTVQTGVSARFITGFGGFSSVGKPYCAVAPNASGAMGELTGFGSLVAASNDVVLTAAQIPANTFGFFITSQAQGFVMNPGGSAGNLCLAGSIGRYVGPGQVQNSGPGQSFSLALDLAQTPQPLGFVSISAGETWNFQAWFRDISSSGAATSNFTNGLEVSFQ